MTDEGGSSLVELLVASLIVSLLMGGLYSVLTQTQATLETQQDLMGLRQQGRVALSQLATELRMTGFDLGTVPEGLFAASSDRVVFGADIDAGSARPPCAAEFEDAVGGGAERIDYRVVEDALVRTVDCWNGRAWSNEYTDQVLARNLLLDEPLFRYLDATGVEIDSGAGSGGAAGGDGGDGGAPGLSAAQRARVRSIVITLVLQHPDRQLLGPDKLRYRIQTRLAIRNEG